MNNQKNDAPPIPANFAKQLARSLLKKSGITCPPIRLNQVFRFIGQQIKVIGTDLGFQDGFSVNGDLINYNSTKPAVRQRFTVAHELGHILMGHNNNSKEINYDTKDVNEQLANIFASELLAPVASLHKESLGLESLSSLAKKYWVSKKMMLWRLKSASLDSKLGSWD